MAESFLVYQNTISFSALDIETKGGRRAYAQDYSMVLTVLLPVLVKRDGRYKG
jgi:hypothetical protein